MPPFETRVNCHDCGRFQPFYRQDGDPHTVVRCGGCDKKHSTDSVFTVDRELVGTYDRDETGALTEDAIVP